MICTTYSSRRGEEYAEFIYGLRDWHGMSCVKLSVRKVLRHFCASAFSVKTSSCTQFPMASVLRVSSHIAVATSHGAVTRDSRAPIRPVTSSRQASTITSIRSAGFLSQAPVQLFVPVRRFAKKVGITATTIEIGGQTVNRDGMIHSSPFQFPLSVHILSFRRSHITYFYDMTVECYRNADATDALMLA